MFNDRAFNLKEDIDSLNETAKDKLFNYCKAAIGEIPIVGGVLGEVLYSSIPNQRQERVVAFIKLIADRLDNIEAVVLKESIYSTDVLQDAVTHSAKAMSESRNQYLANIVVTHLVCDEELYNVKKNILFTLSELTDLEIKYLYARSSQYLLRNQNPFKHQRLTIGKYRDLTEREKSEYDLKDIAQNIATHKLLRLNLLESKDNIEELLSMSERERAVNNTDLKRQITITKYGERLLKMIGYEV